MLHPNKGLDQAAPKFFLPGPREATMEEQVELFEWLQGLNDLHFAYIESVVEG